MGFHTIKSWKMESKAEKVVVTWAVGPTEDVVQALMERLVYPYLSRTTKATSTNPPSSDEQKAVARQMHAVVLLYNYYHRKQKPDLRFLDLASFCKLAVVLKPPLAAFMKVTLEKKSWDLNGAECQFSLTEKAIKKACDIATALNASVEVPNTEGWPISKVAVLLIDSKKENCKLQFGAVTDGVWSLFEKELDRLKESSGGKRKRDNLKASTAGDEILQICYNVVRGITGTESNELVVLGSDISYSLSEEKSATQFYLVQAPGSGTISPKEQIPLKFLVEKLEGPLAEKDFGIWSPTEVVNYYHMLPYVGFISHWLSGKDLWFPRIHRGFAQSTIKTCLKDAVKDSDHTDNDSSRKTTDETANKNSSGECHQERKLSSDRDGSNAVNIDKNANQRKNTAKTNSSRKSYFERLAKDLNESGKGENLVKDNVIVWTRSTKPRVSPVTSTEEVVNRDQPKVDLADKLKNEKNTGCRDRKESEESEIVNSSDQVRNAFTVNANKPAGHDQLCQTEGTSKLTSVVARDNELTSSEEMQNALGRLCILREQLFSQVGCKDTLAQYENCIERIWDGGEVGSARRRIQSIRSVNNKSILMNETKMHDKDHNSKSQTEKQSSWLSGIFVPGKSKCQDLECMRLKNKWKGPRYLVEQSEDTVGSSVKFTEDKKKKALTYTELCAKMGKKQKTSPSKALVTIPDAEVGGGTSEVALNSSEKETGITLGESRSEAWKIVLGQGAHLHLDSSAIQGVGDLLLDDEVSQMGPAEASAYAMPLIVKLLNAIISINQNAITSEEKESMKFAYQEVVKDNENLKASLYKETTKSNALEQQLEGMKGQLEETKGHFESERVMLKLLQAEVEKIEARAILQTRRDLMMEIINGENANWVPVEEVKTCDEMLWQLNNGGQGGGDDHQRMEEE